MLKLAWSLYKKWLLVCVAVVVIVLGANFAYFMYQYPEIREENIDREFERIESLLKENKGFPRDVDFEFALETVHRAREMMKKGELEYQDFRKMRFLNRLPKYRRPMGREYNQLFQQMRHVVDLKQAGKLDQWDEYVSDETSEVAGELEEATD